MAFFPCSADNYDDGYAAGRVQGRADVTSNPNSYGLYTSAQYNAYGTSQYNSGYNTGYSAGQTAGYNSGYSAGRVQGQNDVKNNPSAYGVPCRGGVQFLGNQVLSGVTGTIKAITASALKIITGFCYSNPNGYGGYFGVVYLVGSGFVIQQAPAFYTVKSVSGNVITLESTGTQTDMDYFYAFGVY